MPPKKRGKQGESLKSAPQGPDKIDANADVAPAKTLPPFADDEDHDPKDPGATDPVQDTGSAFVTPERPGGKSRASSPVGAFYIINKETFGHWKFEDKEKAIEFYEITKNFQPDLTTKLMVQDFPSDDAMAIYITALKTMSTPKTTKNPLAASPPAQLPLGLFPAHPAGMRAASATTQAKPRPPTTSKHKPTRRPKGPRWGFPLITTKQHQRRPPA